MKKFVLIGNPNTGKTSLFNSLTGLNQSTGNYPGITVDKKEGVVSLGTESLELIDLPGAYSLEPHSLDEEIVLQEILNINQPINALVYIADAANLRRNLFLFSQICDLEIPCILVINRIDKIKKSGIQINEQELADYYKCPVVLTSITENIGLQKLKDTLKNSQTKSAYKSLFKLNNTDFEELRQIESIKNDYWAWLIIHQKCSHKLFTLEEQKRIQSVLSKTTYKS